MYQHILLPTDGSALSRKAVAAGIAFAREAGAALLGCHVVTLPRADRLEAWLHHDPLGNVAMASREACDLACLAAHGWKGGAGQGQGRVTPEVLRHSRVPVLVHKTAAPAGAGAPGREQRR